MSHESTEAVATVDPKDNVLQAFLERASSHGSDTAIMISSENGVDTLSTAEVVGKVRSLAKGLVGAGIGVGDRIAIFGHARVEWALLDYAIWQAGAISVTIYETSAPHQVKFILEDSGATAAIVEDADLLAIVDDARSDLPALGKAFTIDDGGLDALITLGESVEDSVLDERVATIEHSNPATFVYTSGTTGRPKGCVLTHLNLIWTVRQLVQTAPELVGPENRTLTFLPLAHILARVVQLTAFSAGVPVAFGGGISTLLPDLAAVKPTWLTVVPRVLEKVHDGAAQKAGGGVKRQIFDFAEGVAKDVGAHKVAGTTPPIHTRLAHKVCDSLVYSALRDAMGGELTHVISGGAPLRSDLGFFFNGIGVEVLEGYGLTETTGPATVHRVGHSKPGTVGPPLPGVDVRISELGEIQLAGNLVIDGYWQNQDANDDSFEDGWFRSGDLGEIDADGHVVITGRMKDLIVTAGGKNIAPAPLESGVAVHPLVSHAVVVGDDRPFVAALLTLDPEGLAIWAESNNRTAPSGSTLAEELVSDPDLEKELQKAVDSANDGVSRAEGIRAFRVLPDEFTVDSGELTPTMKVRRANVIENRSDVVESIYHKPR